MELHAAEVENGEISFVMVVSACADLVVDELVFYFVAVAFLPLVVACEYVGEVESAEEQTDDEVEGFLASDEVVVDGYAEEIGEVEVSE
jgi:hypothetical protein